MAKISNRRSINHNGGHFARFSLQVQGNAAQVSRVRLKSRRRVVEQLYEFPGDVPFAVNYNARSSLPALLLLSARSCTENYAHQTARICIFRTRHARASGRGEAWKGEGEREKRLIEDNSWMRSITRRPRCSTFVCSGLFLRSPRFVNSGRPPFQTAENDPVVYNGPVARGHYLMAQTTILPWKHLVSS